MNKNNTAHGTGLIHGGDYNPEQWLDSPEILEQDIKYFKKAHINEATVGIFSWSVLEPEEGVYEFDWLEQIISRLYENGIYTMLATPSGARPKWMADKYPEVLRVSGGRERNLFGGRHNHCYTSPVYREKVRAMDMALARRFRNHPGVIAWHISNELGGECHCPLCQDEFRRWLKTRYQSIDDLNKSWNTAFWSHCYSSFDQIESPSPKGETALHGLNLDWKRFVTARTEDFVLHERSAIRDGGGTQACTINMMYNYDGLNYQKLKHTVDMISWDSYPTWHSQPEIRTALDCGLQHDMMRAMKKQPFWLMESCPSSTNWQGVSKLKRPGMLLASCLHAVAHGADSIQYFQLRQSPGASEKFHGAVIDHYGGADTRVFREVTEVGKALEALSELAGTLNQPAAAIIYDTENRWALEDAQGPRNDGLYYKAAVNKAYGAFRRLGMDVDVIGMDSDLQALCSYRVIAAPMLYLFTHGFEEKIRKFVEQGGIFFLTYWSGIADEHDRCFSGGTPHGLMDVFGLRSMEIDGLYDWDENRAVPASGNPAGLGESYACSHLCELVKTDTASPLLVYGNDFYRDMPAFTCNSWGIGMAYYICADMEEAFYNDAFRKILTKACPEDVIEGVPEGVEVSRRYGNEFSYTIVQNFSKDDHPLGFLRDPGKVLYGNAEQGILQQYQTVVYKRII